MLRDFIDRIKQMLSPIGRATAQKTWPPTEALEAEWDRIAVYRRRFRSQKAELIAHNPALSADKLAQQIFTPVPVGRDICRLSAALLFSKPPTITHEGDKKQTSLNEIIEFNKLNSFLVDQADDVAVAGWGGMRVLIDPKIHPTIPIIAKVSAEKLIVVKRQGRFVESATAVQEVWKNSTVWRMLETHEVGRITRTLWKGESDKLGTPHELTALPEFEDLEQVEETGLDMNTMVIWENVPGAISDLSALEELFEATDEGVSLLRDKARKSISIIMADRKLADASGHIGAEGVVLVGNESNIVTIGDEGRLQIEVIERPMNSEDHMTYVLALIEIEREMAGYSTATWDSDNGAESGRALKIKQMRTLLTLAVKSILAVDATSQALAVALTWKDNESEVMPNKPTVVLGDGLPVDHIDNAQRTVFLANSESASIEAKVRIANPMWNDEDIQAEVDRIMDEMTSAPAPEFGGGGI